MEMDVKYVNQELILIKKEVVVYDVTMDQSQQQKEQQNVYLVQPEVEQIKKEQNVNYVLLD